MTAELPPYAAQPGWQPMGPPPFDLGNAVSWAWRKFRANATTLVLNTLVLFAVGILVYVVAFFVARGVVPDGRFLVEFDPETGAARDLGAYFARMGVMYLTAIVLLIPVSVLSAGFIKTGLRIADGESPRFADMFRVKNAPRIMLTAVLLSLGALVGLTLCYLPGLAFAVFATFTIPVLLDRDLGPLESIKASFGLVKRNFGNVLLIVLVGGALGAAGTFACLVGILVAAPVVMLLQIYAFRFFSGGPIAA